MWGDVTGVYIMPVILQGGMNTGTGSQKSWTLAGHDVIISPVAGVHSAGCSAGGGGCGSGGCGRGAGGQTVCGTGRRSAVSRTQPQQLPARLRAAPLADQQPGRERRTVPGLQTEGAVQEGGASVDSMDSLSRCESI